MVARYPRRRGSRPTPDLDIWLGHDTAEERVEDWRPSRLLTDLLDAEGGYLAPLLR